MDAFIWLLGSLVSGLIGVLLAVLFQEPIRVWLVDRIARLQTQRKRGIDGDWRATFTVSREGGNAHYVEVIRIRKVMGLVQGHIIPHQSNYPELRRQEHEMPLRLRGEIGESFFLTGMWFHPLDTHRYSGSFQLRIDPGGSEMRGKWIGFSKSLDTVDSGEWTFTRI